MTRLWQEPSSRFDDQLHPCRSVSSSELQVTHVVVSSLHGYLLALTSGRKYCIIRSLLFFWIDFVLHTFKKKKKSPYCPLWSVRSVYSKRSSLFWWRRDRAGAWRTLWQPTSDEDLNRTRCYIHKPEEIVRRSHLSSQGLTICIQADWNKLLTQHDRRLGKVFVEKIFPHRFGEKYLRCSVRIWFFVVVVVATATSNEFEF